jgi:hypothetical protein
MIRALLPFLRASQHLSLNKQRITIDQYIVYIAVDKERGLMNSRCSNLSRPDGNQWCHSLRQLQGAKLCDHLALLGQPFVITSYNLRFNFVGFIQIRGRLSKAPDLSGI